MEKSEAEDFPIKLCFRAACGMIGMPPEAFWNITYIELREVVEGWLAANIAKASGAERGVSREELEEMLLRFG